MAVDGVVGPLVSTPTDPQPQTEPPEWPTETNEEISLNRVSNGQSLVRNQKPRTANTPRNRGLFRVGRQVLARVRHTQSLGGGGGSLGRTRL